MLFVAGMLAAGTAAAGQASFQLWQLLVFILSPSILGGQVGYFIGRYVGTAMFRPNARFLEQRYLDEAHAFFEQRGLVRHRDRAVRADREDPGADHGRAPPG